MGWGSGVAMSCDVGCRHGSELALLWLWLWCRPVAIAPIGPLAWEPPYAAGAALEKAKKDKRKKKKKEMCDVTLFLLIVLFFPQRIKLIIHLELSYFLGVLSLV